MGYERKSLTELWLASFPLINKCAGKLVAALAIATLLLMGIFALAFLAIGGMAGIVKIVQQAQTHANTVAIGAILAYALFSIFVQFYWLFIITVCVRILSATAQGQGQPFYEAFSSSIIPSIYQIIAGIILAIPLVILGIVLALISHGSPIVSLIFLAAIGLTIGVRLCYSYMAIMIGGKGPISGFVHSWEMTRGNYLDTLAFLIMAGATGALIMLLFRGIVMGLYKGIPLYFASSFSLTSPVWWLIGIVLALLYGILYFIPMGFSVLVYLNRSAAIDPAYYRAPSPDDFTPLPDSQLPPDLNLDVEANPSQPLVDNQISGPVLGQVSLDAAHKPADLQEAAPKTTFDTLTPADSEVEVSQISVNTSTEGISDVTQQHLDQVYQPRKENIMDNSQEDRMPTILFDDEVAQQLISGMEPKQKTSQDQAHPDEGPDSIKMSK